MQLKQLGIYNSLFEANLIRGKLETYGIDAIVQADTAAGATPGLEVFEGVRVFVKEDDLPEAYEVLERMLPSGSD